MAESDEQEPAWRGQLRQVIPEGRIRLATRVRRSLGSILILLGVVLFVVGAVGGVVKIVQGLSSGRGVTGGVFLVALGAALPLFWGARLRGLTAAEQLAVDSRQPILYLRCFAADERSWVMQLDSYEKDLVALLRQVGPVIAVGHPRGGIGPPGASRVKLHRDGDEWKEDVARLMRCCRLVIVRGSGSLGEGTLWELRRIVQTCDPERVLIGVPLESRGSRRRWRKQYRRFREQAAAIFPGTLPQEAGDALFLTFDSQWNAIPLAAGRGWVSDLESRMRAALTPWLERFERSEGGGLSDERPGKEEKREEADEAERAPERPPEEKRRRADR